MRLLPLDRLGFGWRSHRSALWWLGLLYRRPKRFKEAVERLTPRRATITDVILCGHAIPWTLLCSIVARLLVNRAFGAASRHDSVAFVEDCCAHFGPMTYGIALGIITGLGIGTVYGIVKGIAFGTTVGTAAGIAFGISGGITGVFALVIAGAIVGGIADGITGGFPGGIIGGAVLGIASGIVFGVTGGIAAGITCGIAFLITILRAYYYPVHLAIVWPVVRGRCYPYDPVAWDDLCLVPLPRLDQLLVDYAEKCPLAGRRELARLTDKYPSQRMAALRAQATLIARRCGQATRLAELSSIVAELPGGDRGFLKQTADVRERMSGIARLQSRIDTANRPFLREPLARALRAEIEAFQGRVAGLREPLASEFRAAARNWLEIADRQLKDVQTVLAKTPLPAVFRAGDPVDRNQEAFVERNGVIGEFEGQIMLSAGCPGILLYGRRRMGKSTVLRNMAAFLPRTVRVATESLQNPAAFQSLETFVGQVTRRVRESIAEIDPPSQTPTDLAGFFAWLDEVDRRLDREGHRLLLALDEYEQMDEKIGQGVFSEDLLKTLRESIQSHRRITWVLCGSHDVTELRHAPWPSYLVSVRTVEVPPFLPEETRLLLTEPLKHSPLWKMDDPTRPRFDPGFWGEGGIERVHAEAAGWPHLVQLLAETAVDLVNQSSDTRLEPSRMEQVLDHAVVRGDTVLRLLMQTESELPGEWDYLSAFRRCETQPPPGDERLHTSLRRRLLVEEHRGQWRLRVPLMHRWLRLRG